MTGKIFMHHIASIIPVLAGLDKQILLIVYKGAVVVVVVLVIYQKGRQVLGIFMANLQF